MTAANVTKESEIKKSASRYSFFFIHGQIFHKFSFGAMETLSQHIVNE